MPGYSSEISVPDWPCRSNFHGLPRIGALAKSMRFVFSPLAISAEMAKGLKTNRIDFAKAPMRGSPWKFDRHGQSGTEISELYPGIASKADEIALIRSCYGDAFDHAPGMYLRHSGSQFPGRPSLGSSVAYGLGS